MRGTQLFIRTRDSYSLRCRLTFSRRKFMLCSGSGKDWWMMKRGPLFLAISDRLERRLRDLCLAQTSAMCLGRGHDCRLHRRKRFKQVKHWCESEWVQRDARRESDKRCAKNRFPSPGAPIRRLSQNCATIRSES
jgi:hypothetical protein